MEANTIAVLQKLLDRHVTMRRMEGYGSNAGRDGLILASHSAQTSWAEEPAPMLYCSKSLQNNLNLVSPGTVSSAPVTSKQVGDQRNGGSLGLFLLSQFNQQCGIANGAAASQHWGIGFNSNYRCTL